ncbi:MAG TPA: MBL fold metallo-hydrolase [Thermoprotei archaeon]|nr:MBL fold metallo-hydrolase [Thermoprotei archaeon]
MNEVNITILGGGREVGRAAILVSNSEKKILLDYGVIFEEDKPLFPLHVRPKELSAVFLSHAHLDHSGAVPLLYINAKIPLFTTELTAELSELLIRDFLKISGYYVPFEHNELSQMLSNLNCIRYGEDLQLDDDYVVSVRDAGHIPGSSYFIIDVNGLRILYTGDINPSDTVLLKGADLGKIGDIDVLISESTYISYEHPEREYCEKTLIEILEEVLEKGGKVLIPAFSVGRSQEILLVLEKYDIEYPIFIDGMARGVIEILVRHPECLRDYRLLERALEKTLIVKDWSDRKKALDMPSIIIAPAGMLKGGPSLYYAKKIAKDPKSAIIMVSFQAPYTPGRHLLETGLLPEISGKVKARIEWLDFSSHAGRRQLLETIRKISPQKTCIFVHGDYRAVKEALPELEQEYDFEILVPRNGETISVKP